MVAGAPAQRRPVTSCNPLENKGAAWHHISELEVDCMPAGNPVKCFRRRQRRECSRIPPPTCRVLLQRTDGLAA